MDASSLRRVSMAGAIVAASVAATVGGVALLFRAEGRQAQEHVGHRLGDRGPDADAVYWPEWGNPVHLVIAGDSVADSLGAATPAATVGAILARALAGHAHRAVELRTIATVGARTEAVLAQLDTLPAGFTPDITVVIVGGNDLTGHVPLAESIMALQEVVQALRSLGSAVVLGTCPDFDTLPSLPQPLREFGGQMSRRLAAAQFTAAAAAGAHPVLLGRAVRQIFLSDPATCLPLTASTPQAWGTGPRRWPLFRRCLTRSTPGTPALAVRPPGCRRCAPERTSLRRRYRSNGAFSGDPIAAFAGTSATRRARAGTGTALCRGCVRGVPRSGHWP